MGFSSCSPCGWRSRARGDLGTREKQLSFWTGSFDWLSLWDKPKSIPEFRTSEGPRIGQIISSGQASKGKAEAKAWITVLDIPLNSFVLTFSSSTWNIFSLSDSLLTSNKSKTHWQNTACCYINGSCCIQWPPMQSFTLLSQRVKIRVSTLPVLRRWKHQIICNNLFRNVHLL